MSFMSFIICFSRFFSIFWDPSLNVTGHHPMGSTWGPGEESRRGGGGGEHHHGGGHLVRHPRRRLRREGHAAADGGWDGDWFSGEKNIRNDHNDRIAYPSNLALDLNMIIHHLLNVGDTENTEGSKWHMKCILLEMDLSYEHFSLPNIRMFFSMNGIFNGI